MTESGFCRELCSPEPLVGTGNEGIVRWVLLEDGGPWGAKTPRESTLPAATIAWLLACEAKSGTRVQLIRRPGSSIGPRRRLIVAEAHARADQRKLVELDVELDQLASLDLDAILAAAPTNATLGALWLVCTHGTRDRCCAKWGMPLFEALRQREPERVWQCSHLGGHRFAPTFLTLPDGLLWGRFDVGQIEVLRTALAAGQLAQLESLRGRCCFGRAAQAAECLLRIRDGIVDDAALELLDAAPTDGRTRVRFARHPGPVEVEVEVEPVALDFTAPNSCGDPLERRTTLALV